MAPQPISTLLVAAADGDQAAWDAIVVRYQGLVWSTLRGIGGLRRPDAEDVFQNTWCRLAEQIGRIRNPDALGGWLVTTARREAIAVLKRNARLVPTGDAQDLPEPVVGEAGPLREIILTEDANRFRAAMASISERCRTLLRMLALDPPPNYDEISAALDMPIGSIGPTRQRCLEKLRAEMGLT